MTLWTRGRWVVFAVGLLVVLSGLGVVGASSTLRELRPVSAAPALASFTGLAPASAGLSASLSISPTQLDLGRAINVQTTASGGAPPYMYDYANMPSGCAIQESATFSCTPSQVGPFTIYVEVMDSGVNTTQSNSVPLTVGAAVTASLTLSPSQVTEGQSVYVYAMAGGGSDSYSYVYSGLPSGCTGYMGQSFTCTPSQTGDFSNIWVNVSDTYGGYADSSTQRLQVNSSSGGGNGGSGGSGNNSSNPLSGLLSGIGGYLSILLIFGIIGFVTWILLIVGVWIIAIVLYRRLPKRGASVPAEISPVPTVKCASCSATIPAASRFCSECGAPTPKPK